MTHLDVRECTGGFSYVIDLRRLAQGRIGEAIVDVLQRQTDETERVIAKVDRSFELDQGDIVDHSTIAIVRLVKYKALGLGDETGLLTLMVSHGERVRWHCRWMIGFEAVGSGQYESIVDCHTSCRGVAREGIEQSMQTRSVPHM